MSIKRIEWIDVAKGVAIILVVMGHVTSSYHAAGLYKSSLLLNFSSRLIYSFHMAAFMFISGLLFRNKHDKIRHIKIILLSYGVPYLFFSVIWWTSKTVFSQFINSQLSILDLFLIPICPISFMWFIYALMLMEIVQVIIGRLTCKKKVYQMSLGLFLYFLHSQVSDMHIMGTSYRFSDLIISDIMAYYCYFCIGTCFGKKIVYMIKKHRKESIWGGITLFTTNILIYKYDIQYAEGIKMLMAFLGTTFLIAVSVDRKNSILSFIGKRTLPVYVLHGLCIAVLRIIMGKIGLNDSNGMVPLVICTILGTSIPLGIYELSRMVLNLDFFFTPRKYIKL